MPLFPTMMNITSQEIPPNLICHPDIGVPFITLGDDMPFKDVVERAKAACKTATVLVEHGLPIQTDPKTVADSKKVAAVTLNALAQTLPDAKIQPSIPEKPEELLELREILDVWGQRVVSNALELRRLVTNRLIKESIHPDAKIRIRALELLGKISDVGLFTERSEVTINHRSTSDLESKLREKLQRLLEKDTTVNLGGDLIDVKEVLGVKAEENVAYEVRQ